MQDIKKLKTEAIMLLGRLRYSWEEGNQIGLLEK
jgi:hypothetical protein